MPTEFRAIEAYLSHIQNQENNNNMGINQNTDLNADQKVPQLYAFGLMGEDRMLNTNNDIESFNYLQSFDLTEETKLPPVSSFACRPTPVEVKDQQLSGEHSPAQLLDLDQFHSQDLPFYPESVPELVYIKQEIPDVPTGCCDYSRNDNYSQEMITYEFLINDLKHDIDLACSALSISSDPTSWTVEQTQKWVLHTLQLYKLPATDSHMFRTTGQHLCLMTDTDFQSRSPKCGSTLYSQLEIWKNARTLFQPTFPIKQEVYDNSYDMAYESDLMVHPPPSVSPAPSASSIDSNSMSSTGMMSGNSLDFEFLNSIKFEQDSVDQKLRNPVTQHKQTIHLWQFLKELLINPQGNGNCIKWLDRAKGIFKIEDSSRVARLWGKRKNRPAMNYDKLSRSIRQYYKKGIIKKTEHSKRLVYQFCKPYLL